MQDDPKKYVLTMCSKTTFKTETETIEVYPDQSPEAVANRIAEGYGATVESLVPDETQANSRDVFSYQLLGRLQQDCEYYLGAGARNKKHLWALSEVEQIRKMKELYEALPEKPEWISLADIERYEAAMLDSKQNA